MVEYLYPKFLNDTQEYARSQALWQEKWDSLIRRVRQQDLWTTPWVNTTYVNGRPFQDGNPIFSAVCPSRHLAIRVIQLEPAGDPRELEFWTDTFGEGEPQPIKELVISCVLTQQTLSLADDLISQWVKEGDVRLTSKEVSGTDSPIGS
jgi:hypothetical protein